MWLAELVAGLDSAAEIHTPAVLAIGPDGIVRQSHTTNAALCRTLALHCIGGVEVPHKDFLLKCKKFDV